MTRIGVFDSGIGGVNVLKKLMDRHKATYFYLGDNKRIPYGSKSKDQIIEYSNQIVNFLEKYKIDFYVVACNTIAANALNDLKKNFDKKFIPVTEMGVKACLENEGDVFVLATKATVATHYYKKEIESRSNKKVTEVAALKFVDFIEEGIDSGDELDFAIKEYIKEANDKKIENIVLGCTHYPMIKDQIEKNLTYKANIIDPADYLSQKISFLENDKTDLEIFMTDTKPITKNMVSKILGMDVTINKVIL
ncbi:MAG: glutamate racemase [Peptoniphilaceae bacterium]|nr:glutamate racemase [Peptoniphilaceae bacterium]MDY6018678.1 glutamate racemase [Anaerococcus sp.]